MSFLGVLIAVTIVSVVTLVSLLIVCGKERSSRANSRGMPQLFTAVELILATGSYNFAKKIAGQRLLATAAPALPLNACCRPCRCQYRSLADRRQINRRRTDDGLPDALFYGGKEKRARPDRRSASQRPGGSSPKRAIRASLCRTGRPHPIERAEILRNAR
jgi:hypothetical protein